MIFNFKYRNYAKALHKALCDDAFYITMEGSINSEDSPGEAMLRYLEFSMIEAEKSGGLYFSEVHNHGVSIWSKPINQKMEAKRDHEKKMFLLNHMGENSLKTYIQIVKFMSEKAASCIGKEYWYLSIVGILPEFQGKGFGSKLIKSVLKKTDAIKAPTYLETFTSRNMSFYNRLGYQEIESFYEPTTKAEYWLMAREPSVEAPVEAFRES